MAAVEKSVRDLGALPIWDLKDLYPGRESPELKAALSRSETDAKAFRAAHEGKLAGYSGAQLGAAVADYERIDEVLARLMSYAQLLHSANMTDPEIGRFYQTIQEKVTVISSETLFFALELNRIEDAELEAKLADPALAHYRPWLRDVRTFR
ncbi:MAG: oligoendopeptidase F, partial [Alphaproteobacteria bacterium]